MFKGLFDNQTAKEIQQQEREYLDNQKREDLTRRAAQFDLSALDEARGNANRYQEILDTLIEQIFASQEKLEALVSHISKSRELRASQRLAEIVMEQFKNSPNTKNLTQMLHIAALADDAAVFGKSIELAVDFWKKGLLPKLSAKKLLTLMQSEYWLLSSTAKRSGDGFGLKTRLGELRNQLT
ncbi:MAG: hypothetical protein AB1757_03510 [Acidobacteriota bacterium]